MRKENIEVTTKGGPRPPPRRNPKEQNVSLLSRWLIRLQNPLRKSTRASYITKTRTRASNAAWTAHSQSKNHEIQFVNLSSLSLDGAACRLSRKGLVLLGYGYPRSGAFASVGVAHLKSWSPDHAPPPVRRVSGHKASSMRVDQGETIFWHSLTAGSLSGVIADVVTHPISTLKTRLQVQGAGGSSPGSAAAIARYHSITHAAHSVVRNEGVATLYKGLGITVLAAAPAQGLYFAGYDLFRSWAPRDDPLSNFAAGCFAQLCGSLVWVPMDTIKERLQIEGQLANVKEPLGSSTRALRIVIQKEGIRGLFPAYWIHQFTWMPFNGCYFAVYEWATAWSQKRGWPAWWAGLLAGIIAGGLTNPMDVVKTRLQVVRAQPNVFQYRGVVDCAVSIIKSEGPRGLLDGAGARILLLTPRLTMAIAMKKYIQSALAA